MVNLSSKGPLCGLNLRSGQPLSAAHSCAVASNLAIGLGLTPCYRRCGSSRARVRGVTTIESNAASSRNDGQAMLEKRRSCLFGGNRLAKNAPFFSSCEPWVLLLDLVKAFGRVPRV